MQKKDTSDLLGLKRLGVIEGFGRTYCKQLCNKRLPNVEALKQDEFDWYYLFSLFERFNKIWLSDLTVNFLMPDITLNLPNKQRKKVTVETARRQGFAEWLFPHVLCCSNSSTQPDLWTLCHSARTIGVDGYCRCVQPLLRSIVVCWRRRNRLPPCRWFSCALQSSCWRRSLLLKKFRSVEEDSEQEIARRIWKVLTSMTAL